MIINTINARIIPSCVKFQGCRNEKVIQIPVVVYPSDFVEFGVVTTHCLGRNEYTKISSFQDVTSLNNFWELVRIAEFGRHFWNYDEASEYTRFCVAEDISTGFIFDEGSLLTISKGGKYWGECSWQKT